MILEEHVGTGLKAIWKIGNNMIEGTHFNTMITLLNCELAKLTEWLNAKKLSINVSKSHYMVFHCLRRNINKGDILLDTTILTQVSLSKFLGVMLDNKLKWTHHILIYIYIFIRTDTHFNIHIIQ